MLPLDTFENGHMVTTTSISTAGALTPLFNDEACAYPIDARIDVLVDSTVMDCIGRTESLDDTVDVVAALVRTTAPTDLAETDPQWEERWRRYFAFYDHAVMHAIRVYVEYANR